MSVSTQHGTSQVCTFFLDQQMFGIDVIEVQEVIRSQAMTRVPLAPREVRGLINLRGQIVTALDFRRRLGMPDRAGEPSVNIVIGTADGPISVLVDEIGEIVEVKASAFEPAPNTLRGPARELIRGAYKLPEQLLLIVETRHLLPSRG